MYHMHTLGASQCMHVVHSVGFTIGVGFGWFYLISICTRELVMIMGTTLMCILYEVGHHFDIPLYCLGRTDPFPTNVVQVFTLPSFHMGKVLLQGTFSQSYWLKA